MKKFLAVFDGFNVSKSTLNYAIQLSRVADAHLVGVFLDEFVYRSYDIVRVMKTYGDYEEKIEELDTKDKKKRDEGVLQFEKSCSKAGVRFSIHRNKGFAIYELIRESIFADLIIIDEFETFTRFKRESPTRFIKELLSDVQCPVLVVPLRFDTIDKIVLLYDGGPSSIYAIKMFSYLIGSSMGVPIEVFAVNEGHLASTRLPDNKLMRDFIKRHFPKAKYTVVKGVAEEQIVGHLRNYNENELVVLGAYRRSEISRWFKVSMADVLMKELDAPLFIAHNK